MNSKHKLSFARYFFLFYFCLVVCFRGISYLGKQQALYTFNGFAEALHLRNSSSYCRFIYMKTSFYLGSCFETI